MTHGSVGPGGPRSRVTRRRLLGTVGSVGLAAIAGCTAGPSDSKPGEVAALGPGVMFKSPSCQCCDRYAAVLASHGISVEARPTARMRTVKARYGVPARVASCHTIATGTYVVEGHVPIRALAALAADRPDVVGLALPGMPAGSPGMGGTKTDSFTVYAIGPDGAVIPFWRG